MTLIVALPLILTSLRIISSRISSQISSQAFIIGNTQGKLSAEKKWTRRSVTHLGVGVRGGGQSLFLECLKEF